MNGLTDLGKKFGMTQWGLWAYFTGFHGLLTIQGCLKRGGFAQVIIAQTVSVVKNWLQKSLSQNVLARRATIWCLFSLTCGTFNGLAKGIPCGFQF